MKPHSIWSSFELKHPYKRLTKIKAFGLLLKVLRHISFVQILGFYLFIYSFRKIWKVLETKENKNWFLRSSLKIFIITLTPLLFTYPSPRWMIFTKLRMTSTRSPSNLPIVEGVLRMIFQMLQKDGFLPLVQTRHLLHLFLW